MKPLAGIRVLDLSRLLAGPYCGQLFADLGAHVVKVEPPGGDDSRALGPPFIDGEGVFFLAANGGKSSVVLDLTESSGRDLLLRMIRDVDVLIENYRPAVKEKLGIGYETVAAVNPRIIYCSISGFGQRGPLRDRPGVDTVFQAMSGVVGIIGAADAPPTKVGSPVADVVAGLYAAFAITSSIIERERTGAGVAIEVAIRDALIALLSPVVSYEALTGEPIPRWGNASQFAAPADIFATADGCIAISTVNDRQWQRLCTALGRPDLSERPAFRNNEERLRARDVLTRDLASLLRTRSTAHWEDTLSGSGVPFGRVLAISDLMDDPQLGENELFVRFTGRSTSKAAAVGLPFRIGGQALRERRAPPRLGQQTQEILSRLSGGARNGGDSPFLDAQQGRTVETAGSDQHRH